ncbi:site-specific integrase [Rathayibacter sp. AY1A7]|uniref:site-specific integrase n=1 Tax=Rathayibacter sp. AY1A7 TaxID=2080524 RepID=UPI0015E28175|nr:site-specific integrase [Rathayibacter sp. AY1A7]
MDSRERYPDNAMTFAPAIPVRWQEFVDRREALLLSYGYNTARAYWADLQDWFEWSVAHQRDVLALSERDIKQYIALLRRRKYSESTIRRRCVTLRLLYQRGAE